ncbi:DUF3043 domain-containing protein [Pseudonocardia sp.]|uniref:DUF3043 domain-containing protein n=1 Tax=Pseudonocardia sp. TaxID=60912 RepID=UPI003D151E80
MRFLRRNQPSTVAADAAGEGADGAAADGDAQTGRTGGKGRPTPKRRDAEKRRRGPAPPPPRTQREAMKLAKANRPSKEERRVQAAERRARMDAGDDRYLPPRDRGPLRAYVRDIVDSRRHLIGLFMPLAALVFVSILVPFRELQTFISILAFGFMVAMVIEGVLLGRQIVAKARAKFPKEEIKGFPIGWYAFSRASQPRKLRVPRPRVQVGDNP